MGGGGKEDIDDGGRNREKTASSTTTMTMYRMCDNGIAVAPKEAGSNGLAQCRMDADIPFQVHHERTGGTFKMAKFSPAPALS